MTGRSGRFVSGGQTSLGGCLVVPSPDHCSLALDWAVNMKNLVARETWPKSKHSFLFCAAMGDAVLKVTCGVI